MVIKYPFLFSLSFLLILFLTFSCNKNEIPIDKNNLLVGYWEFIVSSEEPTHTVYHMKRTRNFSEKYSSTNFSIDGVYSYRGSFGIAGQPTLFMGTWTSINDTLVFIDLESPFNESFRLAIKVLNKTNMDYYYLNN